MVDSTWTGKTIRLDQWSQHREAMDMTTALERAFRGAIIDAKKIGKVKSSEKYEVIVGNMQRVAPPSLQGTGETMNVHVSVKQPQLETTNMSNEKKSRCMQEFKQTMAVMRSGLIREQLEKEDIGPCSVGLCQNPSPSNLDVVFVCSFPEWFCYPKNKNSRAPPTFNHVNLVCNVSLRGKKLMSGVMFVHFVFLACSLPLSG